MQFGWMRNLGGSVGIAMVTTFLSRGAQAHQATLVQHFSVMDRAYVMQHGVLTGAMQHEMTHQAAGQMANGVMYGSLLRQATLMAYVDNFRLLALLALFCLPALLLFKKPKRLIAPPGGH